MVGKMSKLAITLLPITEAPGKCCQSLLPVFLVERLQPVQFFVLSHSCQAWKGDFTCRGRVHPCYVACQVESIEDASRGITEEIAQWLQAVNAVLDGPEFAPGRLTVRKFICMGLFGYRRCGVVQKVLQSCPVQIINTAKEGGQAESQYIPVLYNFTVSGIYCPF